MATRAIAVFGTASDVGKSVVATALCRVLCRRGVRVAPFKSQNMSNNAAVCPGGGEIGRAQAVQAEACGLEPRIEMNPVLLKPESDGTSQVVLLGRPAFRLDARRLDDYAARVWPTIAESYEALRRGHDVVVIEGAGGAAEVNLRDRDVANWKVAEMAEAPVLLVADIDRGGVFAQVVGTLDLLRPEERARVAGIVVNRFRGRAELFTDGVRFLEERTGARVLGVLPWLPDLAIPIEDGASLDAAERRRRGNRSVRVAVVRLPRISNTTDFAPLEDEPDVSIRYAVDPADADEADLLILPGSKSTVSDLRWLRETGWEDTCFRHVDRGGWLTGVCGGYQMLGSKIRDPGGVESTSGSTDGMNLLDVETIFEREKVTARFHGRLRLGGAAVEGYRIHSGRISRSSRPLLVGDDGVEEGAVGETAAVWGTSVHGIFDRAEARSALLAPIREAKGIEAPASRDASVIRREAYDQIADALEAHVDLDEILPA